MSAERTLKRKRRADPRANLVRTYYTWVILVTVLFLGCCWILRAPYADRGKEYRERLEWTHINLKAGRHSIAVFAEKMGRYPHSLSELCEYDKKFPRTLPWHLPLREAVSRDDRVRSAEHVALNGKGGFFYDRTTGVLKVNLTSPIKHYWWFYFGEARNDVPADW